LSARNEFIKRSIVGAFMAPLPGRNFQMMLLTIAVLGATFARTAVGPLQEAMRATLALSDHQIAILQGPALALPVVLAAVPLGVLIDRYSRARLLFVFAMLSVVGSVLTAVASNFPLLAAARGLVGLTLIATLATAFSLLADLYPQDRRGRGIMLFGFGANGGNAAAFALGGALLARFGTDPSAWRSAMLWLTVALIPIAMLLLTLHEPHRTGSFIERLPAREVWSEMWRRRAVMIPLLVGMGLVETAFGAAYIWGAPALSRGFGLSPDHIGAVVATGLLISGILSPVAGGPLADMCQRTGGPRRTAAVLSGLLVLSVPIGLLFAYASGFVTASGLLVAFVVIICAAITMGTALFTVVIPGELRGVSMATMFAINTILGIGLAPVAVSVLSSFIGGPSKIGTALALVGAMTSLFSALAFMLARPHLGSRVRL
jgi:MFS family permease